MPEDPKQHAAREGERGDRDNGDRNHDKKNDNNDDRREHPGRVIHPAPTHGDSAVRARLAQSRKAMLEFSNFLYEEIPGQRGPIGVWTGRVRPLQSIDGLRLLLDDLAHDRAVFFRGSELHHLDTCTADHCGHGWPPDPAQLLREFELKVMWTGDQIVPRAFVLSPPIPPDKRPHMWGDGAVCAFLASDGVWMWHTNTVADFLPHVLIWLVKWMVFDQTALWIGSQHGNTPQYHLERVSAKAPCWCGRGLQYRKCHRPADLIAVGQGKTRLQRLRN
jgi:hypothetical protein